MTKLRHCPFCGGKAGVSAFPSGNVNVSCDCSVVMFGGAESMAQMAAKWNTRVGEHRAIAGRSGRVASVDAGLVTLDLGNGVEVVCPVEDLEAME